jgi:hypothetical protein
VQREVLRALYLESLVPLTVDEPCPGTVVLSGVVRARRDHDLAIATARSVADVGAVEDCIDLEC